MKDPIGSFEIIKENFIRYVETAFATRFEGIEKERYALLNYDKVLYRKPWIEPLPDYVSSNKRVQDLTLEDLGNALTEAEANTFKELVATGLFPSFAKLHSHQAEMLKETLRGNNCIITSGTGSGKTESFLLPLFAQLSKELANWETPNAKPASVNIWWKSAAERGLTPTQIVNPTNFTLSNAARQRQHEKRPAGVRALILYPMNALVEDQMSRLRKALDSDDTRNWLTANTNGNSIFFGRYNGSSPIAGELRKVKDDGTVAVNTKKVNQLKERLKQVEVDATKVAEYIQQNNITGSEAKDLKSFFQRLDGSEMRCRFDMQLAPPDIMITNYSMLSIMLMRTVDSGIFEQTKNWLACEDLLPEQREAEKRNRVFHLVIDELHLYRGTQGTEIAYLLKLVLDRLGLHPHHDQLRILASSASLEAGDQDSVKFLEDFFGVDNTVKPFKIIEGHNNEVETLSSSERKLPVNPFKEIAEAYDFAKSEITKPNFISACESSANTIATAFGISETGNGIEKLLRVISNPTLKLKERLYSSCAVSENGKTNYKAVCSIHANGDDGIGNYFSETIFETATSQDDLQNALRGLLIARAMFDETQFANIDIPENRKLPRFRFHYFFRNIEGMWASVKADDIDNAEYADTERTAGKLYSTTRINSEAGNRVLELLYCDNCGTTLFGGSRLVTTNESGNGSFELLPISPNIEGIPEKTPAKLVEKRSYQEYAVFWPCGNQTYDPTNCEPPINQNRFWRQTTANGYDQTDYEAEWIEASLNCISGDIDFTYGKAENNPSQWIRGYYFTIVPSSSSNDIALPNASGDISSIETHRALPNVCPCCGINNQRRNNASRKSKTTSIRGFRTGFAKTTQMFAKELMYQLPDTEAQRKLVVFSDSREDAAQVANGIERNHFTDLLREILVDELHKKVLVKHHILNAIETNNTAKIDRYRIENNAELLDIEGLITFSNLPGANPLIVEQRNNANHQLEKIRQKLFSIRELVDITNSVNLAPLIRHLISLGINPGGNDITIQTRLLNNDFVPWYDLIDFTNFQWTAGADQTFINDLKEGTFSNLATMFFGSLFYSFESSALGFVTINPHLQSITDAATALTMTRDEFLQTLNSTVRILGDKFKHNKNDDADPFNFDEYSRFPSQVKRYIRAVANRLSKTEPELGTAVFNTLSTSGLLHGVRGVIIEELFIKVATATDSVWTSTRGSRPHLHLSGGICTYSLSQLNTQPDKICNDIWEKNYLSYNAIKQQRIPIRLHCEELTGQTDNQFERQRHFRNIILTDEGNKQVKAIDLLSVTTTLEVGVDIGALQAVMLGNMPPQRFNYQQRVGRAGRRGQAYSIILTFCRGRSHDEFYFSNPHKITGDSPPTPFLTMGQERIFKRLLAKEIFRKAFTTIPTNVNNDEEKPSVHGEFGAIDNWLTYKPQIANWINTNRPQVEATVEALITPELRPQRNDFVNWVCDTTTNNGLIEKSQSVISNEEIATTDVSEKLAEGGILPMFGMPTTVKNLYHGIDRNLEPFAIDRAQSMAIYEFAPGAQKTKDKAIHAVIGFTSDIINTRIRGVETVTNARTNNNLPFSMNRWFVRCRSCGLFKTYSETEKTTLEAANHFNRGVNATPVCPACGETNLDKYQRPEMLKAPRAYRTNLSMGSDMKDDSEFLLSRPPIFAENVEDPNNPNVPVIVNNAELLITDKDVTWRVNTNSDNFFTGSLANTQNFFPFSQPFRFTQQWIAQSVIDNNQANPFNENGYSYRIYPEAAQERIALASNKKTEIFRIAPVRVPLDLNLNMFSMDFDLPYVKAQANGVRSGYYSAAFLLQRILADQLDVDPTEIEIADIVKRELVENSIIKRYVSEIILTDELPNGSGFVRFLYNRFPELLTEAMNPTDAQSYLGKIHSTNHQGNCKDACYECLKVFRNMNYHSLLDWRLGLSMMRVLNDATYKCGADGIFNQHVELNGWLEFATSLRNGFAESFGMRTVDEVQGLPIIKWHARDKNVIMIVHPFWDMKNERADNWINEIKNELLSYTRSRGGKLSIVDAFNLHRRPGWCYEKLVRNG
ncbi:MAG: DEAD/DEAH box helicase [Bacteroidetes bacterium]|nr:MAG: DEAD/DEAH box helicase [Bacteroidota bacterium]